MADGSSEQKKPAAGGSMGKHASATAQRRAAANWARREYVNSRGHRDYVARARRNDRFYLGGGLQWDFEVAQKLINEKRRPAEQNEIMQMVNTAVGYQIANRMDIAVQPRGRGSSDESAKMFGRVIKQVADNNKLHWRETEVFTDGMIMQRGYFDIRMDFEGNALGEIAITSLDPTDVIPDPDARDYDVETWGDVTTDRYYTLDHIEQQFGKAARRAVETVGESAAYQSDEAYADRGRFGEQQVGDYSYTSELNSDNTTLYRIVDRQYKVFEMVLCAVFPNGDIRQIPNATPEQKAAYEGQGAIITKRMQRRVKWIVSTSTIVLFDDYSPYPWFTIVPFFPYFRRGQTRGMVDNAISIQETLNKAISDIGHILTTVAHSGYTVQEGALSDMDLAEFKANAAKNGLVLEHKQGFEAPKRIEPPSAPAGMFEFVGLNAAALKNSTGMDESLTASGPMGDQSGVAYQARQYAAQQKLAVPLDNLARTRHMLAQRIVDLIQMFMDAPQVLQITEMDQYGKEMTAELEINQPVEGEGGVTEWLNDLTAGEYKLVISEQPMQVTFDNSNFEQIKSLKLDFGYPVPAGFALRHTNLTDKTELAQAIEEASATQPDPLDEAKIELIRAQITKIVTDNINTRIESIYSATQAAAQLAAIPQTAALGDEILQSSGFEDQNASPIIPDTMGAGLATAAPAEPLLPPIDAGMDQGINPLDAGTNPLTPENPGVGLNDGIEAAGVQ